MCPYCLIEILSSVFQGLISSIFFAIGVWIIQNIRYWNTIHRIFNNSTFVTYWKRFPDDSVYELLLTVHGNKISFKRIKDGQELFEGEIIINPINLKTGNGYHIHKDTEGFAFIKAAIKDKDTILIESPYTAVKLDDKKKKVGSIIHQAFVWRRKK